MNTKEHIMLTVYCLEILAEAVTPLSLDTYCGSALRGAFFRAMWGRFCTNREAPTCDACPLNTACPVASIVAPLRDEAPRGRNIPRPYVITPPKNERGRFEQGETFTFSFTLIGNISKLYPYIIRAFQEMERNNLGHPLPELQGRRGRFLIREIRAYHPFTNEKCVLWTPGSKYPEKLQLSITSDDVVARAKEFPRDHLTIRFLSPMRLITEERILRHPDFSVLVLRLAQRLEQIQHEYGNNEAGEHDMMLGADIAQNESKKIPFSREWYLGLKALASDIRLEQDNTRWVDIQSYSARQRQGMPIGGLVGKASFIGDITPLRDLLAWGEIVRVGKNIVKGGGFYSIEL